MSVIRKYEFGLLDLAPRSIDTFELSSIVLDTPPPPPSYCQEEVEAAEQRGFRAGQAQGEAAALSRIEMRLADTMEQISYAFRDANVAQQEAITDLEHAAARLTLACFKKLFPVFLAECGTVESEALITRAMSQVMNEPRLIVRCPVEDEVPLTVHLQNAARNAGFEGRLCVIPDEKLSPGDCHVEWAHGGMNRDASALATAIDAAIRQSIKPAASKQIISGPINSISEHAAPGAATESSEEFSV